MLTFATIARAIGIKGLVAIGLAIVVALLLWQASSLRSERDKANQGWGAEKASHAVTRASVGTLTATIASLNAEANARADAFEDSQEQAERDAERLSKAAERSQGQIDRLKALAGVQGVPCAVPGELADALEGL